jgi:hypothetical protein
LQGLLSVKDNDRKVRLSMDFYIDKETERIIIQNVIDFLISLTTNKKRQTLEFWCGTVPLADVIVGT